MKYTKAFGIVALVAIITFAMIACGGGGGPSGDPDPNDGGKPFLVELTPSSITFPYKEVGYSTQTATAVTITNTGTEWTNNLSVTIVKSDGFTSTDFVSPATGTPVPSIAPNASGTFNIRPADGLSVGGYAATVNVFNSGGDIHESIEVSFWVITPGLEVITSKANFDAFIASMSANSASDPKLIGVGWNLSHQDFASILKANSTKFVNLDMSGSTCPNGSMGTGTTDNDSDYFRNCTNLVGISLPHNVTMIQGNPFGGCTELVSITFPNTLTFTGGLQQAPGDDLKDKVDAGGAGTYTRPNSSSNTWTKQP